MDDPREGTCNMKNSRWINNCGYSAAYDLLNFIYGGNLQVGLFFIIIILYVPYLSFIMGPLTSYFTLMCILPPVGVTVA